MRCAPPVPADILACCSIRHNIESERLGSGAESAGIHKLTFHPTLAVSMGRAFGGSGSASRRYIGGFDGSRVWWQWLGI